MVVGSVIVALCLLVLGWAKEIVATYLPYESDYQRSCSIFLAVLAIYGVDFAINAGAFYPD